MTPVFTVIRGGSVLAPEARGTADILIVRGQIARVGPLDLGVLDKLGLPFELLEAGGCVVTPGMFDPHSHIIGTGGEQGFASRTSDVPFDDFILAGVTTVVGCLGTDDSTRHISSLVGRARQLDRLGITGLAYTGSFHMPPPTLTGSVRDDLVFIPELVGIGEVAIADFRATEPSAHELARMASSGLVGGLLGEKAGVVHFHVGPGRTRLKLLREVLDNYELPPRQLYFTHLERSDELLAEGIDLARRGCFADFDCIEPGVDRWVAKYLERGGPPDRLTLSSDAHAPEGYEHKLREQFAKMIVDKVVPMELALPLVTVNPAHALKIQHKGRLEPGQDGDVLVMKKDSLDLVHVVARGKVLMRSGSPTTEEKT